MATEAPSLQKTTLTANLREPQRWVSFAVGNSVSPCERLEYAAEGFAGACCHADIVRSQLRIGSGKAETRCGVKHLSPCEQLHRYCVETQ